MDTTLDCYDSIRINWGPPAPPEVADPVIMALLLVAVGATCIAVRSREGLVGLALTGLVAGVVFLGPLLRSPPGTPPRGSPTTTSRFRARCASPT